MAPMILAPFFFMIMSFFYVNFIGYCVHDWGNVCGDLLFLVADDGDSVAVGLEQHQHLQQIRVHIHRKERIVTIHDLLRLELFILVLQVIKRKLFDLDHSHNILLSSSIHQNMRIILLHHLINFICA